MKGFKGYKSVLFIITGLLYMQIAAAQKISIDAAVIRNTTQKLWGVNTAIFYHFTERLSGGFELTRFYNRMVQQKSEKVERSAWDIDLNFHFDVFRVKKLNLYPLLGVGYNEFRETNRSLNESLYERYWALNTGAGIRLDAGILKPHVEYTAVWAGQIEHILLAGIALEFEKKEKN